MSYLSVANWNKYQHYKDRTPIWIKYHVELLHSEKLQNLPIPTRLLWDQMLLLAATFQNSVPNSPELIGNLTGIPSELCREGIAELLQGRWLREKETRRSASNPASAEKDKKRRDKKARDAAKELQLGDFVAQFRHEYPNPVDLASELRQRGADDLMVQRLLKEAS